MENTLHGQKFSIASQLECLDAVRDDFIQWLQLHGISPKDQEQWRLAFSEAVVNSIVHGNAQDPGKSVHIAWTLFEDEISVEVIDSGTGPKQTTKKAPQLPANPLESHGRGLYLISQYCDSWEQWRGPNSFRLLLKKRHSTLTPHFVEDKEATLEQALNEITFCYESLAAFYRLGEGLVRSENVSSFVAQAIDDLAKVVTSDYLTISLTDTLQNPLKEELHALSKLQTTVLEDGVESSVFLNRQEYIWENLDEIQGDPRLAEYPSGVCCPVQAAGQVQGIIILAKKRIESTFNAAELNTIRTFADLIGIAVANANNTVVRNRESQALRELEIAADMQEHLLPLPEINSQQKWEVFAQRTSAREVAGDYLEVCFSKNNELFLVTVDVMGKGVSAAFLAAMFKTALHISLDLTYPLNELVMTLNKALCEQLSTMTLFATCSVARISPDLRKMEVVNAGHCPVLYLDNQGILEQIDPSGPPLGLFGDAVYETETRDLSGGESIYMITDGLYEWQTQGKIWGWQAFVEFIRQNLALPPETLWQTLQDTILQNQDSLSEVSDDQTFLYWHLKP